MRQRFARVASVGVAALALASALGQAGGCDALEQSLQGVAAPLKEPTLPNCSRILTCCTNLDTNVLIPATLNDACHAVATPTGTAIEQYQAARIRISANNSTTPETEASLIKELEQSTQATLEPACRCLLEETIGNLSLGGFLSPLDCEVIVTSGALPAGKECSDVTDVITSPSP